MHRYLLLAASASAFAALPAQGNVIFTEDFAGPDGTPIPSSIDFGATYTANEFVTFNGDPSQTSLYSAGSLSYPGIATSGDKAEITDNNSGAFTPIIASNEELATTGTYFIRFLSRASDGPDGLTLTTGGVSLFDGDAPFTPGIGGSGKLNIGKFGGSPNYSLEVDGVGVVSSTVPVDDTTRLIVVRLDYRGTRLGLDLYVDPGETLPALADAAFEVDAFEFDQFRLQADSALGLNPSLFVDELVLGTTFADVAAVVPEPAAGAAGLLGMSVLAMRRRSTEAATR